MQRHFKNQWILHSKEVPAGKRIYSDEIALYKPQLWQKKELVGKGQIQFYDDSIRFALSDGELSLPMAEVLGITLIGNRIMDIYVGDVTYRVKADHATNLLKYMHTYYIIQNRVKGLVGGFVGIWWQNMPWKACIIHRKTWQSYNSDGKIIEMNIALSGKSNRSQTFRERMPWVEASAGECCESASGSE